jgi:hypothetical protein
LGSGIYGIHQNRMAHFLQTTNIPCQTGAIARCAGKPKWIQTVLQAARHGLEAERQLMGGSQYLLTTNTVAIID